jgi:hypothetical protein
MSRNLSRRTTALLAASGVVAASALLAPPVDAARAPGASPDRAAARVIASGLNNPRHLVFRGGTLYVAEAGTGGSRACHPGPEGGTVCYGATGSIKRLGQHPARIIKGLPSQANQDGTQALGPSGIDTLSGGRLAFTIGGGGTPTDRAQLPASGRKVGTLVVASPKGNGWKHHTLRIVTDLMRFEARHDPDHQGADSDPTGLIRRNGHFLTTDSGGNDLLRAGGGDPTVALTTFGNRTVTNPFPPPSTVAMQSVPTAVAVGPGGALFVSELTGFPFPKGRARIFKVVPGHAPTVWARGLTNVTDLTWYRGSLYAVQIANKGLLAYSGIPYGSLVKVHHGGAPTKVAGNYRAPYAVAMHGGAAYVTTCSVCPGAGQVVRVPLN